MSTSPPQFSAYGGFGDTIGARRNRWSFRFCVAASLTFVAVLWISEYFIGFDRAENLYLSALTKHKESARPLLRQAVIRDREASDSPNPRYVQALAERELEDEILPTYRRAFELDPGNVSLVLRYGCRLFMEGDFEAARQRFRDAAQIAPDNALAQYLEAATIPWVLQEEANILRESLQLLAQANSSGKQIAFPRPLWHPKLPRRGKQYAMLRREAIEKCLAPISRYNEYITQTAKRQIDQRNTMYWDSWLQTFERAGDKLARSALAFSPEGDSGAGSLSQALAGLDMQLQAVRLRQEIHTRERGGPNEEFVRRTQELQHALGSLRDFENAREPAIERDTHAREFACLTAPFFAVLAFSAFLLAAALLTRIMRVDEHAWTIAHGRAGSAVMTACALLLTVVLAAMPSLQNATETDAVPLLRTLWLAMLGCIALLGLAYPLLLLESPFKVAGTRDAENETRREYETAATAQWRGAYVLMLRRFFGVTLGLFLCSLSVWAVLYRVVISLYPWQIELLATGMGAPEVQAVRHALSFLH